MLPIASTHIQLAPGLVRDLTRLSNASLGLFCRIATPNPTTNHPKS